MIEAWTHRDYQRWLRSERARSPRLRSDEVSDDEVLRSIRSVPTHYSGWSFVQAWPGTNGPQTGFTVQGVSGGISFDNSPQAMGAATSPVTIGNYVFVFVGNFHEGPGTNTPSTFSCTDNATTPNSYGTALFSQTDAGGGGQDSFLVLFATTVTHNPASGNLNPSVSSSNYSDGGQSMILGCAEFSPNTLTLDGSNGQFKGPATAPVEPGTTLTTTVANDLILTFCLPASTDTTHFALPSGFSQIAFCNDGNDYLTFGAAYKIASGSYSGDPSWSGATNWGDNFVCAQLALKPATGGGGVVAARPLIVQQAVKTAAFY